MVKYRQGQTSVDRYVEGKTQEYSGSKRGSTIGEQYPTGQGREIIQVQYTSNSPREVQTESEWEGKGLIQETRARIKTLEKYTRQGKTKALFGR